MDAGTARATRDASQAAPDAGRLAVVENTILALFFAAAVSLPLVEVLLRATLGIGVRGVATLIQHATLAVGMLGAAVAAREERLLTLAVAPLLDGPRGRHARLAGSALAAAITAQLALAAIEFVAVEQASGATLVYGFPVWIAQLPLPVGFVLIALRLVGHAADSTAGRVAAAALALLAFVGLQAVLADPGAKLTPALAVVLAALLLGAPIFAAIGGIAMLLLADWGVPSAALAVNHYSLVVNPSLPAIPMFTLAGYLLAESQAPRRLTEVFQALFGGRRGGAALVCVFASVFFTCFTGASGVTILALGGLVMPLLLGAGFARRNALGLVTAAGLPGVLLMPALPLLLYAIVARVGIEDMFVGGLLPAVLMLVLLAAWGVSREPVRERPPEPFRRDRARAALGAAKWELSLPLLPILALLGGLATPVEAAAVTALYAFVITTFIRRDLGLRRDVPRVVAECGLLVGGILLILGVALSFTNYLVDAQVPDALVAWVTTSIEHRWLFLLSLNLVLLAAGCVMDIYTAIVVLAPLVVPLGHAFGIDPVHLGIIFLANLELGYLTPPVGMNLFFASYRFGAPMTEVFRAIVAPFLALAAGVLLITYVPWLSTALPRLLE